MTLLPLPDAMSRYSANMIYTASSKQLQLMSYVSANIANISTLAQTLCYFIVPKGKISNFLTSYSILIKIANANTTINDVNF